MVAATTVHVETPLETWKGCFVVHERHKEWEISPHGTCRKRKQSACSSVATIAGGLHTVVKDGLIPQGAVSHYFGE